MRVHLADEAAFYDAHYRQFLSLDLGSLAVSRQVLERQLDDPQSPFYERRLLYRRALERLFEQPVQGLRVLDYGCGPGDWGVMLATEGAIVTLLDLSPVAIELALRKAEASGVRDHVEGLARDATDLSCFATGSFDLVFACAAIHHVLKYGDPARELARILKPGGRLVILETYGNNLLLNLARWMRARLSREPREQGEEVIFNERHVACLSRHFRRVEVEPVNLLAMAKRLFRGRFHKRWARSTLALLEAFDRALPGGFSFFESLLRGSDCSR